MDTHTHTHKHTQKQTRLQSYLCKDIALTSIHCVRPKLNPNLNQDLRNDILPHYLNLILTSQCLYWKMSQRGNKNIYEHAHVQRHTHKDTHKHTHTVVRADSGPWGPRGPKEPV